jgi:KUP system potassium uptake protein
LQDPASGERFLAKLKAGEITRVPGTTIFLTRSTQQVSRLIMEYAQFVGVLPQVVVALNIVFEEVPRIQGPRCLLVEDVGGGLWRIVARFGFMEIPDLKLALHQAQAQGLATEINLAHVRFVAARDLVVSKSVHPSLSGWRMAMFAFLYHNAVKVVDRFNLPPAQVVEIARQIDI